MFWYWIMDLIYDFTLRPNVWTRDLRQHIEWHTSQVMRWHYPMDPWEEDLEELQRQSAITRLEQERGE